MEKILIGIAGILGLMVVEQERRYRNLHRQTLDVFQMVCRKWRPIKEDKHYGDLWQRIFDGAGHQ